MDHPVTELIVDSTAYRSTIEKSFDDHFHHSGSALGVDSGYNSSNYNITDVSSNVTGYRTALEPITEDIEDKSFNELSGITPTTKNIHRINAFHITTPKCLTPSKRSTTTGGTPLTDCTPEKIRKIAQNANETPRKGESSATKAHRQRLFCEKSISTASSFDGNYDLEDIENDSFVQRMVCSPMNLSNAISENQHRKFERKSSENSIQSSTPKNFALITKYDTKTVAKTKFSSNITRSLAKAKQFKKTQSFSPSKCASSSIVNQVKHKLFTDIVREFPPNPAQKLLDFCPTIFEKIVHERDVGQQTKSGQQHKQPPQHVVAPVAGSSANLNSNIVDCTRDLSTDELSVTANYFFGISSDKLPELDGSKLPAGELSWTANFGILPAGKGDGGERANIDLNNSFMICDETSAAAKTVANDSVNPVIALPIVTEPIDPVSVDLCKLPTQSPLNVIADVQQCSSIALNKQPHRPIEVYTDELPAELQAKLLTPPKKMKRRSVSLHQYNPAGESLNILFAHLPCTPPKNRRRKALKRAATGSRLNQSPAKRRLYVGVSKLLPSKKSLDGIKKLDIIGKLSETTPAIETIVGYLSDSDLVAMCLVSKSWHNIVTTLSKANCRRKRRLRQQAAIKENLDAKCVELPRLVASGRKCKPLARCNSFPLAQKQQHLSPKRKLQDIKNVSNLE